VLDYLAGEVLLDGGIIVRTMKLPDAFIDHDTPQRMYEKAGLAGSTIAETVIAALGRAKLARTLSRDLRRRSGVRLTDIG
jgi:1-deoxy-D-xylulose-5-phosphate synthase